MNKQEINETADETQRVERIRQLSNKYAFRTDSEELRPFYNFFGLLTIPLQILSALFASGAVFLFSSSFSPAFGLVVAFTIGLLLVIEIGKRLSYTAFNKQRNGEKKRIARITVIFCAFFMFVSIFTSYKSAPHTIAFLSAPPVLIDTAFINEKFEQKLATNIKYWNKLSNDSKNKAQQIHLQNNWRGVTSRNARPAVLAAINRSESYKDSLTKYAAGIMDQQQNEIGTAILSNEVIKQTHNNNVDSFGYWFAVSSLFFEFCLFFIFYWRSNFETRELKEGEYLIQDEPKTHVREVKDETKNKVKKPVNNDVSAAFAFNKIGFHKDKDEIKEEQDEIQDEPTDGQIVPPIGRQRTARIYVMIDGVLQLCRPSDLKNHIRGNNPGRAAELEIYLNKLNSFKNGK